MGPKWKENAAPGGKAEQGRCIRMNLGIFIRRLFRSRWLLGTAFLALQTGAVLQAEIISGLWTNRYQAVGTNGNGAARAVALDGEGNVLVTGFAANGTQNDYYTAKYAGGSGALLWSTQYDGAAQGHDQARALAVDGNGDVIVTGTSTNANAHIDYYTVKYSGLDGASLWEVRHNSSADGDDQPEAVTVDHSGNVVVTGYSYENFGAEYYTAKYAGTNGTLLWQKAYGWPTNENQGIRVSFAEAVAVDDQDNVVVTGYSKGPNGSYDYYTAKYAAADGEVLWERRYNGPANNVDHAVAVAVDPNGDVVVTGFSHNADNNYDYYTVKYAGTNGTPLWDARYNGPANRDDRATAMAVDDEGNVIVTGFSINASTNADFCTLKYAGPDGALLWSVRYDGPAGREDQAKAVAVDAQGNVVVAGSSSADNGHSDFWLAKYASADGALLWEIRYDGPANGTDAPQTKSSLVLGADGKVVVVGASERLTAEGLVSDFTTLAYITSPPFNWPPQISGIPTQWTLTGVSTEPIPFTVGDAESAAEDLIVTAYSDDPMLIPETGLLLEGAGTNRTITVTPAAGRIGDAFIHLVVADEQGATNISSFNMSVVAPPQITAEPGSVMSLAGSGAQIRVEATGTAPLIYQWWHDGAAVEAGTNADLVLAVVGLGDAGDYQVVITNDWGSVTSAVASLTVVSPPVIVSDPTNQTVLAGSGAQIRVEATGTAPLIYQWWHDGAAVEAGTNADLMLAVVGLGDAGDYQVVITNDWGSVTSAVATLAINLPPVANDDVIQVELGQTLNLVAAELLANDSDPDLDVLDLVAVQSPSLAGASVILTNDMVIYVAPVVGTNDNFSYTVADLWGATAVGTVQVTLVGWERPDFLRLIPVGGGDGQVRLRFVGAAGVRYALEQAHELSPPIIWTPLETNTTSPEGEIWFTNVLSAAPTNDYYRVRHAP